MHAGPRPDDVIKKPKSNQHNPAIPAGLPCHERHWLVSLRQCWGPLVGRSQGGCLGFGETLGTLHGAEAAFVRGGLRSRVEGGLEKHGAPARQHHSPHVADLFFRCAICYLVNATRRRKLQGPSRGDHLISESASCPSRGLRAGAVSLCSVPASPAHV